MRKHCQLGVGLLLALLSTGCITTGVRGQTAVEDIDYTCNFLEDTCASDWQLDGLCDNRGQLEEPSCLDQDCWDCDPCQAFSYSCSACKRRNGCHWCPGDALCVSQPLGQDFWQMHPTKVSSCPNTQDWVQTCDVPPESNNVYKDVHYRAMKWSYSLINVESVWRQGITGKDVQVRINDDGVDSFHPELIGKFDYGFSCDEFYQPENPRTDVRGTALAAMVGGQADNGACSLGIAPGVKISSCNVYTPNEVAFVWNSQLKQNGIGVDISVNADWGPSICIPKKQRARRKLQSTTTCIFNSTHKLSPCPHCPADLTLLPSSRDEYPDCRQAITQYCRAHYDVDPLACADYLYWFVEECSYRGSLDAPTHDELVQNIVLGRSEKGVIFVVPAGDEYQTGGDANFNGYANSRFTIAVGAVGKDGKHASYSTPGSPIWVSAPGGDVQYMSNNIVAQPGGGCRDAGPGTSFAVPVVAGVAALMLEVKPELTWRDVFAILAKTAQSDIMEPDENEFVTNGAGYKHSYKYGFGIVNAEAAVEEARSWTNFRREEQFTIESSETSSQIIWDDANNATVSTVRIDTVNRFFRTESVMVYVELNHVSRGDLKITLTSPFGTESILAPSKRPETTVGDNSEDGTLLWQFLTVRNFWEYPGGEWILRIVDERQGPDCIDLDFEYSYSMGGPEDTVITCSDFDQVTTTCTDPNEVAPILLEAQFEGRTVFESCCKCGGGDNSVKDRTNELKAWKMVVYGHVAAEAGDATELMLVSESTCQFATDTCPKSLQFNHVCDDSLLNEECIGMDCFDCDACQTFNYDCGLCTAAGCYYCPGDGMCASIALNQSYWELYPDKLPTCNTSDAWVSSCDSRRPENQFDDPLYEAMLWSYSMINIEPVWDLRASGKGIHVRINDDGVDSEHAEFSAGNFDKANSCQNYAPWDSEKDVHGTAVASIVAGNSNNGHCAAGIAPGATISSCVGPLELDEAPDLLVQNLDKVDISTNAWGPNVCRLKSIGRGRRLQQCLFSSEHPDSPCKACGEFTALDELSEECEAAVGNYCRENYVDDRVACSEFLDLFVDCEYHILPMDAHEAFVRAITEGRDGKGIIFVFSAGNTNDIGGDVNFNGFINSRFTIAVGAVGKDKKHASYSTTGAAVLISAPGGDYESISGNLVAKPGGGCHDIGVGTSFAAPTVAGIIALMLQVNADLGWRDVQGILAVTSQRIDEDNPSWITNAAGYNHSYQYGFGVPSTLDALNKASIWKNFRPEQQVMNETGVIDLPIEDNPTNTPTTSTLVFSELSTRNLVIESVVAFLDVQHPSRGDLVVALISPAGTESVLHPSKKPEDVQLRGDDIGKWKLLSLRTWGEWADGDWTLTLTDEKPGRYRECHDLPWEFTYPRADGQGNETISCGDFDRVTDCNDEGQVNPELMNVLYEDRTLVQSCCQCGGGQKSSDIIPMLRSWKLIIYGHIIESPEELLIFPPPKKEEDEKEQGSEEEEQDPNWISPNTLSENDPIAGWDDEGNSGTFSGGGGNAYYGGWRPPRDDDDNSGNSGDSGDWNSSHGQRRCYVSLTLLIVALELSVALFKVHSP
ncbi:Furin-like protease 1, isoform 1 [Seminavis robusta]|uniref:subtilisin n=1 Tax=Seminavis robusta TaxID=568900 RepID=A0A9N8GZG1_9STRA|nr:Furin-like protease 1, isoform 1 [Seminavis robusta]|eukprot:Sro3_g002740.1 Furin-like protease 1, isoform 1 (1576) ;mRNA; f:227035-232853